MEMNKHKDNLDTQQDEETDSLPAKKPNTATMEIHDLPDELLIHILSCMNIKDAVKTSVLSRRWRYLWIYTYGKLEFDDRFDRDIPLEYDDERATTVIERKLFKSRVNHVLKLHQGRRVDSLVIRFTNLCSRTRSSHIDSWIYFAMQKEVKEFELNLSVDNRFHCYYRFPNIHKLFSLKSSVFGSLRSLRLVDVDIKDEVVHYLLASCPCIEHLCIRTSNATKNLEVVDPLPNLKELEISDCGSLESLEISATNLFSCTYQGMDIISSPFKKTPDLTELTLGGEFCHGFVFEPNKHSSFEFNW